MPGKVFISTSSFGDYSDEATNLLRTAGFEVVLNPLKRKLNDIETVDLLGDAVGVIAGTEKYSREIFEKLPQLKVISRVGVGVDNIDFDAARDKDVAVVATATDLSGAVAELAIGLIFDLSRKIAAHSAAMKDGKWSKNIGRLVSGKTLGVIGLGKIGKTLIAKTAGMGLSYLASDVFEDNAFAEAHNVTYLPVDELLRHADIVSLHLKYTPELNHFISADKLGIMKQEALLINTSRGELIDEAALYDALRQKTIGGAGLDVFHQEPYEGNLRELENVVLTPHIGSFVKEIRLGMELEAVQNFIEKMKK